MTSLDTIPPLAPSDWIDPIPKRLIDTSCYVLDPFGVKDDEVFEQALERRIRSDLPAEVQHLYWTPALPSDPLPNTWSRDPVGTHRAIRIRHEAGGSLGNGDFVLVPTAFGDMLVEAARASFREFTDENSTDLYHEDAEIVMRLLKLRYLKFHYPKRYSDWSRYDAKLCRSSAISEVVPSVTRRTLHLLGACDAYEPALHDKHIVETLQCDY